MMPNLTQLWLPEKPFLDCRTGRRKPNYTHAHIGWIEALVRHSYGDGTDGVEIRHCVADSDAYRAPAGVAGIIAVIDSVEKLIYIDFDDCPEIRRASLIDECDRYIKFHLLADERARLPSHQLDKVRVLGPCMGQTVPQQLWFLANREHLRQSRNRSSTPSLLSINREILQDADMRSAYVRMSHSIALEKGWKVETTKKPFIEHMRRMRHHWAVLDATGGRPYTPARKVVQALALGVPVITSGNYAGHTLLPGDARDTDTWGEPTIYSSYMDVCENTGLACTFEALGTEVAMLSAAGYAKTAYDMWFHPRRLVEIAFGGWDD